MKEFLEYDTCDPFSQALLDKQNKQKNPVSQRMSQNIELRNGENVVMAHARLIESKEMLNQN